MNVKEKIPGGLIVPALIASALLVLAVTTDQPRGYYQFLRIMVCGAAALAAVSAYQSKQDPVWLWVLGFLAVLYNPLFPVRLNRDTWQVVDLLSALVLPAGAWKVGGPPKPS